MIEEREISRLVADLRAVEPQRRRAAAEQLGALRDDRVISYLIDLFRDPAAEVREAAVQALVSMGTEGVVGALAEVPRRSEAWKSAARALGKIATPAAIETLGATLRNGTAEAWLTTTLALADAGAAAADVLIEALHHPSPEVRGRAAMALGRAHVTDALAALLEATQDPEWSVRLEALMALAALKDDRAVPALSAALRDSEEAVRQSVPVFLGEIGTSSAIAALHNAAHAEDEAVRWIAEWQLKEMGVA